MSVLRSKDGNDLLVDCMCGCDNGIRVRIEKEGDDMYAFLHLTNANWYRDQDAGAIRCIGRKLKKIIEVIRNKDYYYSEIFMNKEDFNEFKEYINSI